MNELERLRCSKPGDVFLVGFGPNAGGLQEAMRVESNDGRAVILAAGEGNSTHRVRVPLELTACVEGRE